MLVGEVRAHRVQVRVHERLQEQLVAPLLALGHCGRRLPGRDRPLVRPISMEMVAPSVPTDKVLVGISTTGGTFMAIHLTPTELAREAGMQRREVISKCMELGVPIFQGRIDKTLFLASLKESQHRSLAKA